MHRTILSEKPSCRRVSAHTKPAAPAGRGLWIRDHLSPPHLPLMIPTPTCAHNEHVGAATVASTWRDALGHHLGPSLQLQGLGVAREWGAAGSWGHANLPAIIPAVQPHPHPAPLTLRPRLPPPPQGFAQALPWAQTPTPGSASYPSPSHTLTCLLARTYTFSFSIFTCRRRGSAPGFGCLSP